MNTITEIIYNIILYLGITTLWIYAEPIIILKKYFGLDESNLLEQTPIGFIKRLVNCFYCSSFWITLILSYNIELGIITSFFAYFISDYLSK